MTSSWTFVAAYTLLFFGLFFGIAVWRRRSRKERTPFPDNLKLLRGPGESLRRKLSSLDETALVEALIAYALPPLAAGLLVWITTHLLGYAQLAGLIAAPTGLLISLLVVIRHLLKNIELWRNTHLGYFGERIVGEALEPIKAAGFRVFHDVPAGDAQSPFNLDHIIVGPSGVFAIETKTRRKRKGSVRPGVGEHEIIYDGQVLAFPWGEDRHGLDQALRQARWLQAWLGQLLGSTPPVQPILTFPGWMILRRAPGAVTVLNPREIPAAVALRGAPVLTPEQIDLVARQLDARCRDVEF